MRVITILSLLISLIAGVQFASLYVFRAQLYAHTEVAPISLGSAYPVSDTTTVITGFETSADAKLTPILHNADQCSSWLLSSSFSSEKTEMTGPPVITMRPGTHDYVLAPQDCTITEPRIDAIHLSMFFGSAERFGAQNLSTDQYQINKSNIPILMEDQPSFSQWIPDLEANPDLIKDAHEAMAFLRDRGFDFNGSTREKIIFLSKLVKDVMPSGSPPPFLNSISPWSAIQQKHSQETGNFCRQWSLGYGYLANLVGIPTRNVFTGGAMKNVDMGSHAFSESYIPEDARWVLVDPTDDIALVTSKTGKVMNAAEIYISHINGNTDSLLAVTTNAETTPFDRVGAPLQSFLHRDNFLIFIGKNDGLYQLQGSGISRYLQKLERFLFQPKQYFGYNAFTSYHWLRPVSFFVCLISGTIFMVSGSMLLWRRRQKQ